MQVILTRPVKWVPKSILLTELSTGQVVLAPSQAFTGRTPRSFQPDTSQSDKSHATVVNRFQRWFKRLQ